jgi:hypothetical protein
MNDYFILDHNGSGLCPYDHICNQKDNWCSKECQLKCPHTREQCIVNNIVDNKNGRYIYNEYPKIVEKPVYQPVYLSVNQPVYPQVYMLPEEDITKKRKIMVLCVIIILFFMYRRII